MGIKITTDSFGVKVWRSDRKKFPQYAIKFSRMVDDKWVNVYQPIRFRSGVELENGAEIIIDDAFVTMDAWKGNDGNLNGKELWQILEFHYMHESKKESPRQEVFEDLPDSFSAAEDEIPF